MKQDEVEESRRPTFRAVIEQALGPDVLGRLQDVEFEDDPVFGAAMYFDFEGQSFWLRRNGAFLTLNEAYVESGFRLLRINPCLVEDFFNALSVFRRKQTP